jgi:hypothetical protein
MAHAYTPGLRVASKAVIKKRRILPLKGDVHKKIGDTVTRDDVVADTNLPGNVHTINVVNRLGIMPQEIHNFMLKNEGQDFGKGDVLAETKSFISWFKTRVAAPMDGVVESVSNVTGQVLLREPPQPVQVKGYVDGKVVEVIESEGVVVETVATYVQGIFGIGGEVWGELKFIVSSSDEVLLPEKITDEYKDCIVVGGSFASYEAIKKAISVGVKGLIVGGIHDRDLRQILGYDLGVAITGSEKVGITLVLTEGFGEIAMADRTFTTLKKREGEVTSISGATQIRAGVIRPEIIIPYNDSSHNDLSESENTAQAVKVGDQVRVIRQPYFGKIGKVTALPSELRQIESETKARILEVEFAAGESVVIPRANIELIQE